MLIEITIYAICTMALVACAFVLRRQFEKRQRKNLWRGCVGAWCPALYHGNLLQADHGEVVWAEFSRESFEARVASG